MAYIRFTNDGWYSKKPLSVVRDAALRIADACAKLWVHEALGTTCYVGFDTRADSESIACAVAGVLERAGLRAVLSEGPCPMPAINFAIASDPQAVGGFMVGADHRSPSFQGIRVRDRRGRAMSRDTAQLIERMVVAQGALGQGGNERMDVIAPFLAAMRASFELGHYKDRPLKCLIDPLYGTACGIYSAFLAGWGVNAIQIHGEPKSDFNGLHPDAREPWVDECECMVRAQRADLGFVIDGPANRCAVIDDRGKSVPAPKVHALILAHLVEDRGLHGRVVVPRTTSLVVQRQAERLGLEVMRVGQSRVWAQDEVSSGGVLTTADVLGGIKVPPFDHTRNALVTALCVMEMVVARQKPLSTLVDELDTILGPTSFGTRDLRMDAAQIQILRNILPGINPGCVLGREPVRMSHALGLEMAFDDGSWFLVRTSESEPLVRLIAEAPTRAGRDALLAEAAKITERAVGLR